MARNILVPECSPLAGIEAMRAVKIMRHKNVTASIQ
jgi:hypothetical protein